MRFVRFSDIVFFCLGDLRAQDLMEKDGPLLMRQRSAARINQLPITDSILGVIDCVKGNDAMAPLQVCSVQTCLLMSHVIKFDFEVDSHLKNKTRNQSG